MKRSFLFSIAAAGLFLSSTAAEAATFNLALTIGDLAGLNASSRAIIVVDTAGDGFTGISDANTNNVTGVDIANFSFTSGSMLGDDYVLGAMTALDFLGTAGFQGGFDSGDVAYNTGTGVSYAGRQLAVYFFPSGSNAVGQSFGYYRSSNVGDGTLGYFVPNDGASDTVASLTVAAGGSPGNFNGSPSVSGIVGAPEPSRMVLAGLGLMGLMLRRRRK